MFSNDIIQFINFIRVLPKEIYERIIISIQLFVILAEILSFFFIRNITKDY